MSVGLRTAKILLLALVGLALCLSGLSPPVAAHEHVSVGEYEFVVGWREEPPVVGVLNGLDLGIRWLANGTPVDGVQDLLTATLTTGSASMISSLEPQFGRPGWYTFDVIPTREGSYTVRIQGSLEGTAVDVTVELETVMARSDVEFPVSDPTAPELEQSIQLLGAENAALRGELATVTAVAIGAVVVGVAGLGTAAIAWRRSARKP